MENELQDKLDIEEMEKTAGWQILSKRLYEEIGVLEGDIQDIVVDKKRPEDIGTEYIIIQKGINGLRRIFEIVEDIKQVR